MLALDTNNNGVTAPFLPEDSGKLIHAEQKFADKKTKDHYKNTFENLNKLHEKLSSENNLSLESMEGISENQETKLDFIKTLRDKIPIVALAFASTMHLVAGFSKATKALPENLEKFFNEKSLLASKAANLYNFVVKGVSALKHGRS